MDDTSPEIMEKMWEMIRLKTPIERAQMTSSMFDSARALIIRFLLEENPNISEVELKKQLFLKLYGNDFSSEEKEKILNYFDRCAAKDNQ